MINEPHSGAEDRDLVHRVQQVTRRFTEVFGAEPDGVWRAPGRVNLIGEHTDYNHGFVLPLAIGHSALVAVRLHHPNEPESERVRAASTFSPGGGGVSRAAFDVASLTAGSVTGWGAYIAGVVYALSRSGAADVPGFDLLLDSTVPVGAGLSSSHAMEVATIVALDDLLGLGLSPQQKALLTQQAENDFIGVPTGIMDQSASLMGREGSALFLDCRSLESRAVPLPLQEHGLRLLVMDTRAAHSLADGEYAKRRASCELAARTLGRDSLRDVALEEIEAGPDGSFGGLLDPKTTRRARHVVTENGRVLRAVELLERGDFIAVGELLNASHTSLREDFEVSCAELDSAVEAARAAGALGARMTGGGFGGSAIALIHQKDEQTVRTGVLDAFERSGFRAPQLFTVLPSAGADRGA